MIAHDAFRRLAARAIDGALTMAERHEQARHRPSCAGCRRYEAGLVADVRALESLPPLLPPSSVDRRIEALWDDRRMARGLSTVFLVLVVALVMVAAIGASLAIGAFLRDQAQRLPARPAVPAGWSIVLASSRDVRLALPPYVTPFYLEGSIMANEDPGGNSTWFQVYAVGPGSIAQPRPGQAIEDWLLSQVAESRRGPLLIGEVALPAGRSLQVRTTYVPGTPQETTVTLFAIATDHGYALLQLTGRAQDFANHEADIALIPYLLEAGPMLEAALGPPPPELDLVLDLPDGWFSQPGRVSGNPTDEWVGFVANAPIPADLCRVDLDTVVSCYADRMSLAPDEFIVSILHLHGGVPVNPATASPLPDDVDFVLVAGAPTSRLVELASVANGATWQVTWEVPGPGDRPGFWLIRLLAGPEDFEATLGDVQALLERARFVAAD